MTLLTPQSRHRLRPRTLRLAAAAGLAFASILAFVGQSFADSSHDLIEGSGSSWAANAVNQWIADVNQIGLQVDFTSSGSALGRRDFANVTSDFAVSDIGFQGSDSASGADDSNDGRAYAYLPIVAGGTSFPYQLKVAGQLVKNLRLSGQTLAKIFTNQITNWNDPAITADNNGHGFPSLPIIPVVHSEGSGSTAQFTRYLDKEFPNIWRPYAGFSGLTEYYPRQGQQIAQPGSDGVINYVTSAAGNGSIGFDEYSYALAKGFPVAKIENSAGFYNLPTQYNVAVALTQAIINTDPTSPEYLLQNLDPVYTYNDPRTYPLSSYSYAIIPTSATDKRMTTAKRQTIVDYLDYSVCDGQKEMGPIGYSPLPVNLVQASFDQVAKLKTADAGVDVTQANVSTCNNPTFVAGNPSENHLADIAQQPPACDMSGQGPCAGPGDTGTGPVTQTTAAAANSGSGTATNAGTKTTKSTASTSHTSAASKTVGKSAGTKGATTTPTTSGSTAAGGTGAGATVSGNSVAAGASSSGTTGPKSSPAGAGGGASVDPGTGQQTTGGTTSVSGAAGDPNDTAESAVGSANPTTLASSTVVASPATLGSLTAAILLMIVVAPPLLARRLRRRPTVSGRS